MNLTDVCDFKNLPLPLMDGATNSEDEIVAASRPSKSHLAHQSDMQVTEVDPELTRKIRELGQLVRADTADDNARKNRISTTDVMEATGPLSQAPGQGHDSTEYNCAISQPELNAKPDGMPILISEPSASKTS